MPEIDILIEDERWRAIAGLDGLARAAVAAALAVAAKAPPSCELSMLFTDDGRSRALNAAWRGKDEPTNVLSFPAKTVPGRPADRVPLGDIALAFETVVAEAAREVKPVAAHAAHLMVHGVLHLLGYDHDSEAAAEAMERLEVAALAKLGIADPYRNEAA